MWLPRSSDSLWSGRELETNVPRSEEHTSELQSRLHLVCRLLLEKKKKNLHLLCPLLPVEHGRPRHHADLLRRVQIVALASALHVLQQPPTRALDLLVHEQLQDHA